MPKQDSSQHASGEYRSKLAEITPYASEIPDAPLGPFGDIPAAYAVLQAVLNEDATKVERTYYVYVSPEYCRLANCKPEDIVGYSHLEVVKTEIGDWTHMCYEAIAHGLTSRGVDFSVLTQGWVSYSIAPTLVKNCCICAFAPFDEEERMNQLSVDAKTSQVIADMLGALAGESGYNAAMNAMLDLTAEVLPADRLCVFVANGAELITSFEKCAEGIPPQLGTVSPIPIGVLDSWFKTASKKSIALIPDTSMLVRFSKPLYDWCVASNIGNLLAAPFYNEGEIVGFLGAYNYTLDGSVDMSRVFSALSAFIGARIDNHRLIQDLAWTSNHDALTGLLNRRGANYRIGQAAEENGDVQLVMALIDLDDLKGTNDRYGHTAGDKALEAIGQFMTNAFPESAILCRNGGDEFYVVLLGDDAARAEELIGNFSALQMEYEHEGVRRPLSASIGFARSDSLAEGTEGVFSKADKALYAVKRSGKSGCLEYSPDME